MAQKLIRLCHNLINFDYKSALEALGLFFFFPGSPGDPSGSSELCLGHAARKRTSLCYNFINSGHKMVLGGLELFLLSPGCFLSIFGTPVSEPHGVDLVDPLSHLALPQGYRRGTLLVPYWYL